ncbi:MAG: 30S ribosomal protein S16 [Micavibrio aeruginosavorus]|uniref:Small ribosomal subunit protein bS16 n=1 Tax=Micavibrio aeruginosavorus TaxID=349221 RepID=A0A7T5R184_9BACT|nr:MAG: 30S ribosomal protein S16 [Micavibrio aeruginosavorus]
MALKLRMSRQGRKNLAFYHIVVADSRAARDGKFVEKIGVYDPRLPQGNEKRVVLNTERIKYWLSQGAQPSERVAIFLGKAGLTPMPAQFNRPKKSAPKAKTVARLEEKAAKKAAAEEAAKAATEAAAAPKEEPAAETPAE